MLTCLMKARLGSTSNEMVLQTPTRESRSLQSPKKSKRKLSRPQLGGEELDRRELAACLNSIGSKSEVIPNKVIAAGFDDLSPSPSAKRRVTFKKDKGNKNSGINATNDSKRRKTSSLSQRIDDIFSVVSDTGGANPSMAVSEKGKQVRTTRSRPCKTPSTTHIMI